MTDDPQDPDFDRLLQYLLENRGFDFSGYKRTTLHRRLAERMSQEGDGVAMVRCEALGASEYRDRTKMYATDVDEEALTQARQGRAELKDLEEVPEELREKYFEREGDRYVLRSELRRSIIFGRHDL